MTPQAALEGGLAELALGLPEAATGELLKYVALIEKWNRTYNLTAIRAPLDMVSHHLLDSLAVVRHLPMTPHAALADVGSGAGLPGIPLAIARPQWRITLNDSSQKKTAFLRQAAIDLRLSNVAVHEGRVESWRPAMPFAVVISRAFADVADLVSRCRHLVAPGGTLAAMTGAAPQASPGEVISLRVPLLDARRHLVLWRVGETQ
jgi:16S rRNA (guanine527-N7)-methyltransferase